MAKKIVISLVLVFVVVTMVNVISAELIVSDAGVQYDSEILDFFNNQTLAEKILNEVILNESDSLRFEEFIEIANNQIWLKVLVRLKDNSGLPVTSVNERDKWFGNKLEEVLQVLPKSEIKEITNHIYEFRARITKEGFERLINNSEIKEIILEDAPLPSGAENEITINNSVDSIPLNEEETGTEKKSKNLLWILVIIAILVSTTFLRILKKKK